MPKREIGPRNIEVTRFTPFRRIMSAAVRLSKPATAGKPDRKQGTDYELSGQDTRKQGQLPRTGCLQMQALRRGWLRQQRLHKPELLGRQMPQMRKEHLLGTRIMTCS